ncbi:MAG: 50S ribosomal protein L21 [bacterium]
MYAIVESRGRQYKVSPGDLVELDLMKAEPGTTYTFDKVLMLVDDDKVVLDKGELDKVKVSGVVTGDKKGHKLIVFKYKRRKDYHRKLGHRQEYTLLKIESIENPS